MTGGDMAHLKDYVTANMLWNPKQDPAALISKFLAGYYGSAAPAFHEYLAYMDNVTGKAGFYLHESEPIDAAFLAPQHVLAIGKIFKAAQAVTTGGELARVQRATLGVYFVVLQRWYEIMSYAIVHELEWPFLETPLKAFNSFATIFNATSAALGGDVRFSEGSTNGLAWLKEQSLPSCNCSSDWILPSKVTASSQYLRPPLLTGQWNAGGYPPAWIEFELPPDMSICQIRATVVQVPASPTVHDVLIDGKQVVQWSGSTKSGEVLVWTPPAPEKATTVRIATSSSKSWVSWDSIQIGIATSQ